MSRSVAPSPQWFMGLRSLLDCDGVHTASAVVEAALDLDLRLRSDLELAATFDEGSYFEYRPATGASSGIESLVLRGLDRAPDGWLCRRKVVELAIGMRGSDILEVGRVAAWLERFEFGIHDYEIGQSPVTGEPLFWRSHRRVFESRVAAAPGWASAIRGAESSAPPSVPSCEAQLVFGFETHDQEAARALVETLFCCPLAHQRLHDHPTLLLGYGEPTTLRIRPNQLPSSALLYPSRPEHSLLLDVSIRTRSLLDLGRVAAHVEDRAGPQLGVVAYTVFGDLLRDGVSRAVVRCFSSASEAVSTWQSGHSRSPCIEE